MKTHNWMWEDKSTHMADRAERQREKAKEQGTRERETEEERARESDSKLDIHKQT